jgi:hypothetical protein
VDRSSSSISHRLLDAVSRFQVAKVSQLEFHPSKPDQYVSPGHSKTRHAKEVGLYSISSAKEI